VTIERPPTTTVTLVDGVRIVVPDSLDLLTPYVLLERQDWFEDEIRFVRRLLKPGQNVIDIGANCGVYALSMARAVGPAGRVWAFEPASSTARLLAEGIAANGFAQVVLERSALSAACGTAQLSLDEHAELNTLAAGRPPARASEAVPVVTLDECLKTHGWCDIDLVKIDAEGEESNILKGGARFFAELSPLVQYEIRDGAGLHLELARAFAARGYDAYRLVPGLGLLIPFDAGSTPDAYLLNLFCCKRDRAERLAAEGLLLAPGTRRPATGTSGFSDAPEKLEELAAYGWRHTVAKLPYGARLASRWERTMAEGNSGEVDAALAFYALSGDASRSLPERFEALEASFSLLGRVCDRQPSYLRLASLARVAQEYGARSLAVDALKRLSNAILQRNSVAPIEPFLAPGRRFDTVAPGEAAGNWVLAAVLEELERLESFSSFFDGISARERLENIHALGFAGDEMERRLRLVRKRFGLPAS
jgi:FkbM family methyltransferase